MAQYDLRVFQPGYPVTPAAATADSGGASVTGLAGLLQRYLVRLFLRTDTVAYADRHGCEFLADVARARTEPEVFAAFARADATVGRQLRAEEVGSDGDDERYAAARLDRLAVETDGLYLTVRLRARSGAEGLAYVKVPDR